MQMAVAWSLGFGSQSGSYRVLRATEFLKSLGSGVSSLPPPHLSLLRPQRQAQL